MLVSDMIKCKRARVNILSYFNRKALEQISTLERPWLADRATITANIIAHWDSLWDEIEEGFDYRVSELKKASR